MYRLVVFDLDGTLMDSLADLVVAINRLSAEYGGRSLTSDEVARMVGEGAGILVQRAIDASGSRVTLAEALPRFLVIYDALLPGQTRPYSAIPSVVESAARVVRLAVLTNKPADATRKLLDTFDLSRQFFEIIGGDGAFRRKPHPDGLLHLASAAGILPSETLLVGDSTVDLQTAHNAGTGICVARYGFGQVTFDSGELRGDEHFIDSPEDLLAILRH